MTHKLRQLSARIRRSPRFVVACIAVALVPIALAGVAWMTMATHQLVPGMTGCRFVRDAGPQIACYTGAFRTLRASHGLQGAMRRVDKEASEGAITVAADCHLAWHPIGESDGRRDAAAGKPFDEFNGKTTCQEGYAHGYTIGFLGAEDASAERVIEVAEADCSRKGGGNDALNCIHAIGHTLARKKGATEHSVDATCSKINYAKIAQGTHPKYSASDQKKIASYVRFQCAYGAQMEFGLIDYKSGSHTVNTCGNEPSHIMERACYSYLPSRATAMGGSLDDGAAACEKYAPAGELREMCVINYALGLNETWRCDRLKKKGLQELCRAVRTQSQKLAQS